MASSSYQIRDLTISLSILAPLLNASRHPHAAADGWTIIGPRNEARHSPDMRGFTSSELHPHTDRSFLRQPPTLVCFLLMRGSRTGGDVFLIDTAPILRRYGREELSKLQNELWLTDASGAKGQPLFSLSNDLCINRYRHDCLGFPRADSRPGRKYLAELERDIASPIRMKLHPGDGYLIHNHRILHGRSAFTGNRQGARLLAFIDGSSSYSWLNLGFRLRDESQPKGST